MDFNDWQHPGSKDRMRMPPLSRIVPIVIGILFLWTLIASVYTVPSDSVGGFMAATAILAFIAHEAFETTFWPEGAVAWAAIVALGLGPLGVAFFVWDWGVKRGDIRVLGAASYAAPLISTLLLLAFGRGEATGYVLVALTLIVGGAVLAAKEMLFARAAD